MIEFCRLFCAFAVAAAVAACGFVPQAVSRDDPRVVRMFAAMAKVDRAGMGFTDIPADAPMRLESRRRAGYDAMLHVGGRTRRTIAFRRAGEDYVWIHEQEIFEGPRTFDTPDGVQRESITITFESSSVSGAPLNKVSILYFGPDEMGFVQDLPLRSGSPRAREMGLRPLIAPSRSISRSLADAPGSRLTSRPV